MYDIHNHLEDRELLKRLRFKGAGVLFKDSFDPKNYKELSEKSPVETFSVVEINAKRPGEVKRGIDRFRNKADILMVNATEQSAVRAAVENKRVDVLAHAFVDQTSAKAAADNKVALEINLNDFLSVYGIKRANLISKLNFNLRLARKYKTPLVVTTGAKDQYDIRSPKQIMAFMEVLGMTHAEAKKAIFETPKGLLK